MATQEEVAELREDIGRLRLQSETFFASEMGRRIQIDADLKAEILGNVDTYMQTAQEGIRAELLGLAAEAGQQAEEGARSDLMDTFFQHVMMVEEKFKGDVEEARQQLAAIRVDLAEVKTLQSSFSRKPPRPLRSSTSQAVRGSMDSTLMAEVFSGRTGASPPCAGSLRSTSPSKSS